MIMTVMVLQGRLTKSIKMKLIKISKADSVFKLTLFAEFDHIVESFNVDPDCQRHILLANCRE